MPNRATRRAAERLALKAARQTAALESENPSAAAVAPSHPVAEPVFAAPMPEPRPEPSAARLAANRANAQHSTGPTSAQGKAFSSLNAVKTGLTGRTVVLPSDDALAYQNHMLAYQNELKPVGAQESDLVASVANGMWRLNAFPALNKTSSPRAT